MNGNEYKIMYMTYISPILPSKTMKSRTKDVRPQYETFGKSVSTHSPIVSWQINFRKYHLNKSKHVPVALLCTLHIFGTHCGKSKKIDFAF